MDSLTNLYRSCFLKKKYSYIEYLSYHFSFPRAGFVSLCSIFIWSLMLFENLQPFMHFKEDKLVLLCGFSLQPLPSSNILAFKPKSISWTGKQWVHVYSSPNVGPIKDSWPVLWNSLWPITFEIKAGLITRAFMIKSEIFRSRDPRHSSQISSDTNWLAGSQKTGIYFPGSKKDSNCRTRLINLRLRGNDGQTLSSTGLHFRWSGVFQLIDLSTWGEKQKNSRSNKRMSELTCRSDPLL